MRIFFALLLLLATFAAAPAGAADVSFPDPGDAMPGANGLTYLDLARQVLPNLQLADGAYSGREVVEMRHVAGAEMDLVPPETFGLHDIAVLPVKADGRDRLLLLFDLGQGADMVEGCAALALYDLAETLALIDSAEIGFDRNTYFRSPASIALAEGSELVMTTSVHFNSSQNYVTTALVFVHDGRLQFVDAIFTFDDRHCGFERKQTPEIRVGDRGGRAYADIVATITETVRRTDESCDGEEPPEAGTRTIKVDYRWDEALSRFVADSDAFEILAAQNQARF